MDPYTESLDSQPFDGDHGGSHSVYDRFTSSWVSQPGGDVDGLGLVWWVSGFLSGWV